MSNKPKMVEVTDAAELKILARALDELDTPLMYQNGGWYADADELRAWRESQNTSTGERE